MKEEKKCKDCGLEKEITEFHLDRNNKDGYRNNCKSCRLKKERERYKNIDLKAKASKTFSSITQRCTNEKKLKQRPNYKLIDNNLDKDEFIEWYCKNYFKGCEVDRIDNDGHYEMSNIQLLSKIEHNKKAVSKRIFLESDTAKCTLCKKEFKYSLDYFYTEEKLVSKYNPLGIRSRCKKCENINNKQNNKPNSK